ncbi:hypothetical protein SEA_OBLADI_165 [Gordonia phage ObLaDi]|uniref:Uncharacterized protein n=1 Tax=Gordonia phage ObLaDi TaxID=2978487 RepID=A0A977KLW0_9CAUD|nr:hypothetical protein SEA_OBLADI_165 [Gordonia phage ObLaDi]
MSAKMTREQVLAALKNPGAAKKSKSRKKAPAEGSKYTAEEKAKMDAEGKGLSGAVKEWAEKFKAMSDSEFWIAICFRTDADLRSFIDQTRLGVAPQAHILGQHLIECFGVDMSIEEPPHKKMGKFHVDKDEIKRQLQYKPHPDPLAGLEYTDSLHLDARIELDALAEALRRGQDPLWARKHAAPDDTEHWIAVAFDSREVKDKFLRLTGWDTVGNKYINGHKLAHLLDTTL